MNGVDMTINQTRQKSLPLQIDTFYAFPNQRRHLRMAAYGEDLIATNGHCIRVRPGGLSCKDVRVIEDADRCGLFLSACDARKAEQNKQAQQRVSTPQTK